MKYLGKTLSVAMLCTASWAANASFMVSGEINSLFDGATKVGSTVDKWFFTVGSDNTVTFDVLSWEADEEGRATDDGFAEAVDVNGDGEIAFIDSFIYLFADDGDLTADDLIDFNDDSDMTYGDGSLSEFDSFLSADLFAGNYMLAIGASDPFAGLSVEEAISGVSSGTDFPATCDEDPFLGCFVQSSDSGDYRIAFSGDVAQQAEIPEPLTLSMLGMGLLMLGMRKRA